MARSAAGLTGGLVATGQPAVHASGGGRRTSTRVPAASARVSGSRPVRASAGGKAGIMTIIIYLALCIVVGLAGRRRPIGFVGYFVLSLLLTPIVPLLFLLVTQKQFLEQETAIRLYRAYCRRCGCGMAEADTIRTCNRCGAPL